jgi:two-component system NarL family response regulator
MGGQEEVVADGTAVADERIRVLIADDHELFRRGLGLALEDEPDIELVGEAADGSEAVERAAELEPDVVLMDVRMPGADGIEATQRIRTSFTRVKVVMLTSSEDESDLFAAVCAGANGYLLKDGTIDEIADTVRAVARGQSVVAPVMASKLLAEFAVMSRRIEDQTGAPRLTEREIEVLRLVAQGMSNKEIAADLVISQNTVKNHVRNILDKLQLRSRTEAAMYAVRERLIEPV